MAKQKTGKNYSATVTGVCLDEKGKMTNTIACYNGESFYSFLETLDDVANEDAEPKFLYEKDTWFTRIIRSEAAIFYITDSDGNIHTNASGKWKIEEVSPQALSCLWISPEKTVYTAGAAGIVYIRGKKGWQAISPALGQDIHAIGGAGDDNILVAGDAGLASHFNGKDWTPVKCPRKVNFTGVCWHSSQYFLLCGRKGTFFELSGTEVRSLSPGAFDIYGVTLYRNETWLALGEKGVGRWVKNKIEVVKDTFAVYFITSFGKFLATAGNNSAIRYDGKTWIGPDYE